jgi:hypothetical protein
VNPDSPSENTQQREHPPNSCQEYNRWGRRFDETGDDSGSKETGQRDEERRERLA